MQTAIHLRDCEFLASNLIAARKSQKAAKDEYTNYMYPPTAYCLFSFNNISYEKFSRQIGTRLSTSAFGR
jgi:hypothetical protein